MSPVALNECVFLFSHICKGCNGRSIGLYVKLVLMYICSIAAHCVKLEQ